MTGHLTFTCMHCAAQHRGEGAIVAGAIQKSRTRQCSTCRRETMHFAARDRMDAEQHWHAVQDELQPRDKGKGIRNKPQATTRNLRL